MIKNPQEPEGLRVNRSFKRWLLSLVAVGSIVVTTGCTISSVRNVFSPYEEMKCRAFTDLKARATARSIWREKYAHCYGSAANARDIKQGFIDGFVESCMGGDGCPPLVPPQHYCAIGRQPQAKCWFQGFPLGVAAAESSGACNMSAAPINPYLSACMTTPSCNPGCVPCEPMNGAQMQPRMIETPPGFHSHDPMMHQNPVIDQDPAMVPPAPIEPLSASNEPTIQDNPAGADEGKDSTLDRIRQELKNRELDAGRPQPAEAIERAIDDDVTMDAGSPFQLVQEPTQPTQPPAPAATTPKVLAEKSAPSLDANTPKNFASQQEVRVDEIAESVTQNDAPSTVFPAPQFISHDYRQTLEQAEESLKMPSPSPSGARKSTKGQATPPVVGAPVTPVPNAKPKAETPVVGAPVQLPNIQVGYDWEGVDWLFGDVDITAALLEQEIPSLLDDE